MLQFSSNEETVLSAITTLIYLKDNETKAGDNSDRINMAVYYAMTVVYSVIGHAMRIDFYNWIIHHIAYL